MSGPALVLVLPLPVAVTSEAQWHVPPEGSLRRNARLPVVVLRPDYQVGYGSRVSLIGSRREKPGSREPRVPKVARNSALLSASASGTLAWALTVTRRGITASDHTTRTYY